jgi:hypothetical protein
VLVVAGDGSELGAVVQRCRSHVSIVVDRTADGIGHRDRPLATKV